MGLAAQTGLSVAMLAPVSYPTGRANSEKRILAHLNSLALHDASSGDDSAEDLNAGLIYQWGDNVFHEPHAMNLARKYENAQIREPVVKLA